MLLNKGAARAQDQRYNLIDRPKFEITELFLMRPTKTSQMQSVHPILAHMSHGFKLSCCDLVSILLIFSSQGRTLKIGRTRCLSASQQFALNNKGEITKLHRNEPLDGPLQKVLRFQFCAEFWQPKGNT